MRVIGRKLPVYPAQVEHGVDLSNQMIWRNHLIQIKRIKELTLPDFPPTHHEPPPRIIAHRRNHGSLIVSTRVLQHGVIPGSCHTKAQGISSPRAHEAILMWPRKDGEQQWCTMLDWTCR
jgi:hypothetical protein